MGSAENIPPIDQPPVIRDEFLKRATPIIAEARGINAQSRVRLAAVASELGLSDQELEAALAELQGGGAAKQVKAGDVEAFDAYLEQTLPELPRGVLTSSMETMLVFDGVDRFGLEDKPARQAIRRIAQGHQIRFISEADTAQHVAALVQEKMGDETHLDDASRQRICNEASQWGMTPDQVDEVIREHCNTLFRQDRKDRALSTTLIAGAGVVLLAVAGGLGWLVFGAGNEQVADPNKKPEQPPEVVEQHLVEQTVATTPAWWDADTSISVGVASQRLDGFDQIQPLLGASSPEERSRGYAKLVSAFKTGKYDVKGSGDTSELPVQRNLQELRWHSVSQLCTAFYVQEPDDEAAHAIAQSILSAMPGYQNGLPSGKQQYEKAFWVSDTIARMLMTPEMSASRRQFLVQATEEALAITGSIRSISSQMVKEVAGLAGADDDLASVQSVLQMRAAVSDYLLLRLLEMAPQHASSVAAHLGELLTRASAALPEQRLQKLLTKIVATTLEMDADQWSSLDKITTALVLSSQKESTAELLRLYERTESELLRTELATLLLKSIGFVYDGESVEQVAEKIRTELDIAEIPREQTHEDRVASFVALAEKTLALADEDFSSPDKLAQQMVDLARVQALGVALWQRELAYPIFDQRMEEVGPSLAGDANEFGSARVTAGQRPLTSLEKSNIARAANSLVRTRGVTPIRQLQALKRLSLYTKTLPDLTPEQGYGVATLLLKPKSTTEHNIAMDVAGEVGRWKQVRLALADLVMDSKLTDELIQKTVDLVLARPVVFDSSQVWRENCRRDLLQSVLEDLEAESGEVAAGQDALDWAQTEILKFTSDEAKAIRAAAKEGSGLAGWQRAIVDKRVEFLSAGELSAVGKEYLAKLPQRLVALDYVADSELSQMVMLQDVALHLAVLEVAAKLPDRAERANEIVVEARRRNATHLLEQMRNYYRSQTELWLLAHRK